MKPGRPGPQFFALLIALVAIAGALMVHPACALALLIHPLGLGPLGVSYTAMNPQTAAGITGTAPNNREEAWAKKIILGAFNLNVFSEYHIGTPGSGKAFVDYTDTRRIRGNKIYLTDVHQLGSSGAQGETERNGKEEKINPHEQSLMVGRQWYGMGVTTIAQAETIVGSEWDNLNSPLLEQRVGLKKSNDMQMVLRESATSDNRVCPNQKSLGTLKTADTFQTSVITKAGTMLSGNGAVPATLVKSAKRGVVEGYAFTGALDAFVSLYNDPTYQSVVQHAGERGSGNSIISGKFSDWNGHIIHPLQIRLRGGRGSVGSPLLRRAFLGIAVPADTSVNSGVITGGGSGYAAGHDYFEHFSGFAYKLTNGCAPTLGGDGSSPEQTGSVLTGDGAGPWYVAIIDKTTGKYALFSYTGNTGKTLTGVKRLGASATGNIVTTLTGSSMTYSNSAYNASSNPITTLPVVAHWASRWRIRRSR